MLPQIQFELYFTPYVTITINFKEAIPLIEITRKIKLL